MPGDYRAAHERCRDAVIADGVASARIDYEEDPPKLRGWVAGFEACRGMDPAAVGGLLREARARAAALLAEGAAEDDYFEASCFEAAVERVASVISAALAREGQAPIVEPSPKAARAAAEILASDR